MPGSDREPKPYFKDQRAIRIPAQNHTTLENWSGFRIPVFNEGRGATPKNETNQIPDKSFRKFGDSADPRVRSSALYFL